MDNKDTEIRDGMKVGVDPDAIDQTQISQAMCKGKDVEFVKMPFESTVEILHERSVDCIIIRNEKWFKNNTDMTPLPVTTADYPINDTVVPAVLVNKNNYGIKKLLSIYFSPGIYFYFHFHLQEFFVLFLEFHFFFLFFDLVSNCHFVLLLFHLIHLE